MSRSFDEVAWPRRTERLELRRITADDAPAMFAYRRDPEVSRWLSSHPTDLDAYAESFLNGSDRNLAVLRDGALIGDAMIRICDAWSQQEIADQARGTMAEIGWCLAPAACGHGYGTEIARELLAIAFDGLGLRRVEAGCFVENRASWHIMEKVGMRREQYAVRESLHRDGTWRDGITYALLADEWQAHAVADGQHS